MLKVGESGAIVYKVDVAAEVLAKAGATYEKVRQVVLDLLNDKPPDATKNTGKTSRIATIQYRGVVMATNESYAWIETRFTDMEKRLAALEANQTMRVGPAQAVFQAPDLTEEEKTELNRLCAELKTGPTVLLPPRTTETPPHVEGDAVAAEYDRNVNVFVPQQSAFAVSAGAAKVGWDAHRADVLCLLDDMIAKQESAAGKAALMLARKRIAGE